MKKLFLAIAAVAMVFATSCKKENTNAPEEPAGDNEFICVIDQNANPQNAPRVDDGIGQMAHIDADNNVWWQEYDEIAYYGKQVNAQDSTFYTLTCSKMSDNRAYFSNGNKHFGQGKHKAYYPASLVKINGTDTSLVLPNTIEIEEDMNAAHLPMYGTGSGLHYITFHNICAVLKIKIPEVTGCTQIVLSATQPMCGAFTIGQENSEYCAIPGNSGTYTTLTVKKREDAVFYVDEYVYVPIFARNDNSPSSTIGSYDNFTVTLKKSDGSALNTPTAINGMKVNVNKVYPVTITVPTTPALLSGVFSVSATRQVQFTRGNLYWSGVKWHLESNQVAFPTEWNTKYVGHFYFSETANSAYDAVPPTSASYLFCDENHKLTVDGTSDLYVLTSAEWRYIIDNYTNRASKEIDGTLCLLIANDATTDLTNISTADAIPDNVLCLPAAGCRHYDVQPIIYSGNYANYMSSTLKGSSFDYLFFYDFGLDITNDSPFRTFEDGAAIRLVKTYAAP